MNHEIGLKFVANVLIPQGFILAKMEDYKESIVLEESKLATNVVMENFNCDEEGICRGTRNIAILTGMLNYNVTLGEFLCAEAVDSIACCPRSQFSQNDSLQINKTLGWSYNDKYVSTNYVLDCKKGEEYIVNLNGERILKNKDCYRFMKLLNDPNYSKTICITYVLRVYSGIEKD